MSKLKSAFFCQNCGYESTKWVGKCPSCSQWNTFVEELIQKNDNKKQIDWTSHNEQGRTFKTISLADVNSSEEKRIITKDIELDRVLGGGIVLGSLILVAGEPGIGKSTLFFANRSSTH